MHSARNFTVNLLVSACLGFVASFVGLYLFGLAVGTLPTPPKWIAQFPRLYVPGLRFLIWLPIIGACSLAIARLTRSNSVNRPGFLGDYRL
jgi:hypothetical protein